MRKQKYFYDFVDGYYKSKERRIFVKGEEILAYGRIGGRFSARAEFLRDLCFKCTAHEVRLYIAIVSSITASDDVYKSGVVKLVYQEWKEYCSARIFGIAINNLVDIGGLVRTPRSRYYIINPDNVCRIFKSKSDIDENQEVRLEQ